MAISQMLINLKIEEIKEVKRQGVNKISVELFSYEAASGLLNNNEIKNRGYNIYIPYNSISCRGVIRSAIIG